MTDIELAEYIKLAYFKAPVLTPDLFNKVIDLIIRCIKNSGGTPGGKMTPEEIRDALQSLVANERLSASAIKDLAENVILINPDTNQPVNIIEMVDYLLEQIKNGGFPPGPGTGELFFNDKGEYIAIDWSMIKNKITKTSQLENDGEDGSSRYIQANELGLILDQKVHPDTGIISGCEVINATTRIQISSGEYIVNDYIAGIVYLHDIDSREIDVNSLDLTKSIAYIAYDKNKNIIIKYEEFTPEERRLNAVVGYVEYYNGISEYAKKIRPELTSPYHQLYDLLESIGTTIVSGNKVYSESGLKLSKTRGKFFGPSINPSSVLNPHTYVDIERHNFRLNYVYNNVNQNIVISDDVITTFRLSGGNFIPLSTGTFGFTKMTYLLNGKWIAEMSELEFNTIDEAKDNIINFQSPITVYPKKLLSVFVIYKENITNLNTSISVNEAAIVDINAESIDSNAITYQQVINALGYIPENVANKAYNLQNPNHTTYPTTQAVVDGIQDAIDNLPTGEETHNFVNQSTITINYQIDSPVKAFLYVNGREAYTTIEYDQDNKVVNVLMKKQHSGYVIVKSMIT